MILLIHMDLETGIGGEFKLHPDLELEERINQFEILKDHKEELRKRREKFLSK